MKKTLLLQTALVAAAGLMLADAANAQTKAVPIGVTVGGYMTRAFMFQDRGNAQVDQPSKTFGQPDAEIWFNIRSVLDNGTVIGGRVELEGSTEADQIDESYLFVEKHDLGRIEVGSTDLVPNKMLYGAPNAIPGESTTVTGSAAAFFGGNTYMGWFAANPNDSEHINVYTSSNRYFGSKVGKGLQLGFSYAPNVCQDNVNVDSVNACQSFTSKANNSTPNNMQDVYALAANYVESFGPVDGALYVGWYSGRPGSASNATGDRAGGIQGGVNFAWNVGGGSQIQLGGLYTQEESDAVTANRHIWTAGLKYLTNGAAPGSVGLGLEGRKAHVTGSGDEDLYMLGVTYQVATGILTFAGVGHEKIDSDTAGSDNKQNFGKIGMRLDF
ncbi:MAG TPA: porin [Ferrovibrio sp.]|uniref:porin n=1 Tax=Ferrovibrio sp. TaxID=1917215 RepID=UPI002ED51A2F